MALRFRRNLSLLRGVRINFSKSGASLSLGGRGLSVNLNRDGVRTTAGIPGSGLSYSTRAPWADCGNSRLRFWGFVAAGVTLGILAVLAISALT